MNLLIGMVVPAVILSCVAGCALALAAKAPPRLRFWISIVGVAAWIAPWPLIHRSTARAIPPVSLLEIPAEKLTGIANGISDRFVAQSGASWSHYWFLALFLPGLTWFAYDCLSYRRTVAAWRRSSCRDDSLRESLPASLKNLNAAIHVVLGSSVAAATGILHPSLWIGDRFVGGDGLEATLTHEFCHIRRRDPLRLAIVAFVARAYCWNPFVGFFARRARFFLEASCDQECAVLLGKDHYRNELARLILRANEEPALPRIVPTALTRSHNLSRLTLLGTEPSTGMRLYVAFALCLLGGFVSTTLGFHVQDSPGGLQAVLVWRNGDNGDRFWRTGNAQEDAVRLFNFWEQVGDYILMRKDSKLYYVNDPATVKGARAAFEDMLRKTMPHRQRMADAVNAQMPADIRSKLQDLQKQHGAIWDRLQPVPGGFGNPDDALFAQLEKIDQQIQGIQQEQGAKVKLQHPEWKAEDEKVNADWILHLRTIASTAFEKGLARPKPDAN